MKNKKQKVQEIITLLGDFEGNIYKNCLNYVIKKLETISVLIKQTHIFEH